jgi:hypothetical protein
MPPAKRKTSASPSKTEAKAKAKSKSPTKKTAVKAYRMDKDEIASNRWARLMDFVWMFLIAAYYYFYGWLHQNLWQDPEYAYVFGHASPKEPPMWLRGLMIAGGFAATGSLLMHMFDFPPYIKMIPLRWKVSQVFASWTYLTRWTLALQCVHHVCVAIIAYDPSLWATELGSVVAGAAPVVGALGMYASFH